MEFLHKCCKIISCILLLVCTIQCSVNLALNRQTSLSSTFNTTTSSRQAVDGKYGGLCAVTGQGRTAHFQVKLTSNSIITYIKLVYDATFPETGYLRNHKIYMSATDEIGTGVVCYSETRSPSDIDPFKNDVFCYAEGQFMTYHIDQRTAGVDAVIRLCEVEIFGCPVGFYGSTCSDKCSSNCNTPICEPEFGRCIDGCQPGFSGERCTNGCPVGFYDSGVGCDQMCSANCKTQPCEPAAGMCIGGCQPGFTGDRCTEECPTGSYGAECALNCTHCLNSDCFNVNGTCKECISGFTGIMCDVSIDLDTVDEELVGEISSSKFIIVIAVLTLALLLLIVVIAYFMFVSRRHKPVDNSPQKSPVYQNSGGLASGSPNPEIEYEYMNYDTPDIPGDNKEKHQIFEYETPVARSFDNRKRKNYDKGSVNRYGNAPSRKGEYSNFENPNETGEGPVVEYEGLQMDHVVTENKHMYESLKQHR